MSRSHLKAWILPSSIVSALCAQPIAAQIVPDTTLPMGERSQVSGNPNVQIDGGARRGGNLFHSFSQFSVLTGGSAFFNNAADVQNIFSRVTGSSVSNIDGLMRANGTANLFLLNPNGILFGPNASLNIGGSFVATTANAIGFPNGEVFSSDATQPLPSQLLTMNPNALFFNQLNPQPIVNQSTANNGIGLQVPAGQSLLLIGGDVRLEGGQIISPGSRVELGAVVRQGSVGLSEAAGEWQLSFPDSVARADVAINNGAMIDVRAGGGGSIAIAAKNLTMSGASRLRAGINTGLGFAGAQSGDIQLNATETINLTDGSLVFNVVRPGGSGNAGNVNITTGSLALTGRSALVVNTYGQGNAGSVNINARDTVSLANSDIFNTVEQTGIGNTGGINITTGSLALTGSSQWVVITYGQGNTGSVNINARDTVSLDGFLDGFYTTIFNAVGQTGIGNAGSINITTGSLALTRGARLQAYVEGQGNAGSININARDTVSLDSSDGDGTTISNKVGRTGIGNTGGINITTGSLALTRRAQLRSFVQGQGNAGSININARDTVSLDGALDGYSSAIFNTVEPTGIGNTGGINITTGSLALTEGAQLLASTAGQGNASDIIINARDRVLIDGASADGLVASTIYSRVKSSGVGQGGNVAITTGSLSLTNGGAVNTSTEGQGNAGRVTIHARDSVQISGTAPTSTSYQSGGGTPTREGSVGNAGSVTIMGSLYQSGVFTTAREESVGDAGSVTITTGSLSVSDQGRIITDVRSQGKAGAIQIQASDTVLFDGGDALSTLSPGAVGRGGDIKIEARSLSVLHNAQLSSATAGAGNAGNITASADTVIVNSGGRLLTTTSSNGRAGDLTVKTPDLQLTGASSGLFAGTTSAGDAGNLTIQPRGNGQSVRVSLQDGAQISASTASSGRGGELTIAAPESITLIGNGSIIAAGTGGSGAGGNLNLTTGTLNIQNQAEVTVSSAGTGSAGNLFVAADRIFLNNQGSIRADTTGGGGNINLRSPFILLRNGSDITTNATGDNIPGGNIAIDTRFLVAVLNEDSNISANSEDFRGGNVRINAFSIFGIRPSPVSTPLSDITATGATAALPGTIDVITSGLDLTSGLVALPTDLVDSSGLIAQRCPANEGNSFVIVGRGGLPPTPEQQLDDDAEWSDRRRLVVAQKMGQGNRGRGDADFGVSAQSNETQRRRDSYPKSLDTPIIEATGVQVTATGAIFLVATTPVPTVQNRLNQAVTCQGR